MYYVIVAVVCLVVGYGLGIYSSKKVKDEIWDALETLNKKIDDVQKKLK